MHHLKRAVLELVFSGNPQKASVTDCPKMLIFLSYRRQVAVAQMVQKCKEGDFATVAELEREVGSLNTAIVALDKKLS